MAVTPASTPAGIVEIEIAEAVIRVAPGVDWRHARGAAGGEGGAR